GLRAAAEDRYNVYRLDPNALIPTGPGLPRWSWQTIWLSWRGPVERDQRLHLMLASPRVTRMLAFLRVALTGLLLACVAGGALRSGGLPAPAARALVLGLVVLGTVGRAHAEFPSPDLLSELQKRLLERPECAPECASSPRLRLEVTRGALSARREVDAATETAVPLPGSPRPWPQPGRRLVRRPPPGPALALPVPLAPGESVATPWLRVQRGRALVSMGPQVSEVSWHSILDQPTSLVLRAPEAVSWTEIWRLDASPIWHVEVQGIPVVHRPAEASPRLREWHPWPGEGVTITIVRPGAVPGPTLTVDQAVLETRPGLRARDTTLTLEIRSSRRGQHPLTLPEGAELQSVS